MSAELVGEQRPGRGGRESTTEPVYCTLDLLRTVFASLELFEKCLGIGFLSVLVMAMHAIVVELQQRSWL